MSFKKGSSIVLLLSLLISFVPCFNSFPLSTKGRWIYDDATGERVKLSCVNWPSHIGPMLAEGLDKKPLNFIVSEIVKNHFNCIRFTWATYMFTRANYSKLTVEQSFDALNLTEAKAGIEKNNAFLLRMTVLQAFETVVDVVGANGIMVILDNHISQPKWCCSNDDQNGFQGDAEFHPEEWLRGLTSVAKRFKGKSQVIAMSLRNEMRGPHQNVTLWYKYVEQGAKAIHQLNPDVLVFGSGLDYATNLAFLHNKSLSFNLDNKLAMEAHAYSWSDGSRTIWVEQNVNNLCTKKMQEWDYNFGFVINSGVKTLPLFLGEFGVNEQNLTNAEDRFLSCLLSYIAERDLDWALWGLQGGYYFRQGKTDQAEDFGLLDINWSKLRNPRLQERLRLLKSKVLQDANTDAPTSFIMYHPHTGSCVQTKKKTEELRAGICKKWSKWIHDGDEAPLRLMANDGLCLKAVGEGDSPILSYDCMSPQSKWKVLSSSKLQLGAKNEKGDYLCLQIEKSPNDFSPILVTRKCVCLGDDPKCLDDSTSQWFKLVPTDAN